MESNHPKKRRLWSRTVRVLDGSCGYCLMSDGAYRVFRDGFGYGPVYSSLEAAMLAAGQIPFSRREGSQRFPN